MKPADYVDTCQFGDVRAVMRQMIADGVKVQTIVTSPPYWGLRSYLPAGHADKALEIGSEPTFGEFLSTMVEVFDLCHQLLRADGTLWLNMGDSYAGSRGVAWGTSPKSTASRRRDDHEIPRSDVRVEGLKPKDLVGQPWRLAFALQDAGWWLRQDIVWNKPNPMPESTNDRCTKAHEYVFLLSKRRRYYFDWEAIAEPVSPNTHARLAQDVEAQMGSMRANGGARADRPMKAMIPSGWATGTNRKHDETEGRYSQYRNNGVGFGYADADPKPRTVGRSPGNVVACKGQAAFEAGDAHHRTKAGLLAYAQRHAEAANNGAYFDGKSDRMGRGAGWRKAADGSREETGKNNPSYAEAMNQPRIDKRRKRSVWTVASEPYKGAHFATFPRRLIEPCVLAGAPVGGIVFDPFFGSGTTGQVAQQLGRHFIGIDINRANQPLQAERLKQPSLFLEAA